MLDMMVDGGPETDQKKKNLIQNVDSYTQLKEQRSEVKHETFEI